jgi:hypothetical protein
MSKTIPFAVGVVVCTLHPQDRTNAIIINETTRGDYVLLTDFGNIIHIPFERMTDYYEISKNYQDAVSIGYPLPTIAERIQHQINLLDVAHSVVKQLECFTKQP